MTDAAALVGAITSLKAAFEITKSLVGLRDATVINSRVIELQGVILAAQSGAMEAQQNQAVMLERVYLLEKEVADLKAWDAEKEKYELKELRAGAPIYNGALAYALKEDAGSTEPKHYLCPNCYQEKRKSILQRVTRYPGMIEVLLCQRCSGEVNITGQTNDYKPASKPSRKSR